MMSANAKAPWASRRLGLLIRRRREERGWTQEDLAGVLDQYGIHWYQSTVNRIESGNRTITWDEAIVICAALNLDLAEAAQSDVDYAQAATRRLEAQMEELSQQARDTRQELAIAKKAESEARIRYLAGLPEEVSARELRAVGMGATTARQVKANRRKKKGT